MKNNTSSLTTNLTLLDVLSSLRAGYFSPTRRRDLISSVKRVAEMLNLPPDRIPACVPYLREKIIGISAGRYNIVPRTLQTLTSNFFAAISATREGAMLRTAQEPLTPSWIALVGALPDRRSKHALSRLSRYCSSRLIDPASLTPALFAEFEHAVHIRTRAKDPTAVSKKARLAWNRLAAAQPELGLSLIPVERRAPKLIPWLAFCTTFTDEVAVYCAWLSVTDRFDDNARRSPLRPGSIRLRRQIIQAAATALVQSGVPVASVTCLACLTTPEAFKAIMRVRCLELKNAPNAHNMQIAKGLLAIAREWTKPGDDDLSALKAAFGRVPKPKPGMTAKNWELLRKFDDPDIVQQYLAAPQREFARALTMKSAGPALVAAQAALTLAVLSDYPLRLFNLTHLEFGRTLDLRGDTAVVDIPPEETKTGERQCAALSTETSKMLQRYHSEIAPAALGRSPRYVFCNRDGTRKAPATVENLFTKLVKKEVGIHMTPHETRHVSAKFMLAENPGGHEEVRQLLGHASSKTTATYYAPLDTARAAQRHQDALARARESLMNSDRERARRTVKS
ncbi:site-specific integrase [Terrarubrum flagellatum]|uniref:site-specific integrase n=1 Tax=Terrirubrum flagellatum TaxID=2895980 RepID=UPI003144DB01